MQLYTLLLSAEKLISKKFGVTHADVVDGEESIRVGWVVVCNLSEVHCEQSSLPNFFIIVGGFWQGTAATLLSRLLTLNLEHLLLSKPVPEVDPVDLRDRPGVPSV